MGATVLAVPFLPVITHAGEAADRGRTDVRKKLNDDL